MKSYPVRTRIAPTPSGFLHMGNLFSFVLTWLIAKGRGGTVRLRIDDLDTARRRPAYLEDIFKTLDFIGLLPDEGPSGVDDFLKNHSQVFRFSNYNVIIQQLKHAGYLYACSCSRSQIEAANPQGKYQGTCRNRNLVFEEGKTALRLAVPEATKVRVPDFLNGTDSEIFLHREMGDFIVLKKDGQPAYQVASLSDDLHYGINLVVRGEDLLASTAAQLVLAEIAGLPAFAATEWHHHPLVKSDDGRKLSKSAGDLSIGNLIEKGISRKELLSRLASMLGLPAKACQTLADLQDPFNEQYFLPGNSFKG